MCSKFVRTLATRGEKKFLNGNLMFRLHRESENASNNTELILVHQEADKRGLFQIWQLCTAVVHFTSHKTHAGNS